MSSDWGDQQTIGELIAREGGSIKTGPFGTTLKASEYTDEGVPLISVREIGHGRFHIDSRTPRVSTAILQRLPEYILQDGDIVFARKGGIERCALVGKKESGWFLGSDGIRLRPPKSCDSRFLAYVLQAQSVKDWLTQNSTGSTMASLNQATIARLPIALPELIDQRKIADLLQALDDRITLLRETNTLLEQIAQTIFNSWFVDFDPVRAKQEGRIPEGIDEETAALFPDSFEESELGMVPRGWRIESLDKVANYLNGLALQKFPPEVNNWLPVIKIAQLKKGDTTGADRASRNLKPEYIIQNGDVLFSWSGSLEVKVWCGGEGALNQHLFKVTSDRYPRWFYLHWTRHYLPHFQEIAASKATTMGHIQRRHLSDAKAVIPSQPLFEAANAIIGPLLTQGINTQEQAQILSDLRDTLLPRLISGKLRLPEAEAMLSSTDALSPEPVN
jgi:type I restriction enzyme S subunit